MPASVDQGKKTILSGILQLWVSQVLSSVKVSQQ